MKKLFPFLLGLVLSSSFVNAQNAVQYFPSELDYMSTIETLRQEMDQMGLTIFAEIDHFYGAKTVEISIQPVYLIVFGNPKAGSKLMAENPAIGFELPLKLLIMETEEGVMVGYLPPSVLKARYEIKEQDGVFEAMHKLYNRLALAVMPSKR